MNSEEKRYYLALPFAKKEELLTSCAIGTLDHTIVRDIPTFGTLFEFVTWALSTLYNEYNESQLDVINLTECLDTILARFGPLTVANFDWGLWVAIK